jgi:UDP-N-acetylmuramoylalanine--D-glutamate ligase
MIGRDGPAIEAAVGEALGAAGVQIRRHASLQAATAWCFEVAQPGDAVLLSPACASLDMFRDYAHRAQVFVDTVHTLAHDRGEMIG